MGTKKPANCKSVTFKVNQSHWCLCHSIGHRISYESSTAIMSLSHTVSKILSVISQNLKIT